MHHHDSHIAICIATYKRPGGLQKLIESLDLLTFRRMAPEITLVIIDNAPETPASAKLGDISALSKWRVIYQMEPTRGIVAARNAALDHAPGDADFLVFVDDDEIVSAGWLEALMKTQQEQGATVVQGPVIPAFDRHPPQWIRTLGLFEIGPFADDQPLHFAATNNSIVDARFVREHGLRFDMRFNTTGGEDQDFYDRIQRAGGTIWASAKAFVYDTVPENRMAFRWLATRSFRTGNTLSRIALMRREGRVLRFCKGAGLLLTGALRALFALPFSLAQSKGNVLTCYRGLGMLAAYLNIRSEEYGDAAIIADRKHGA